MSSDESQDTSATESGELENKEIVVDEDWKKQVKAEDAALDQKLQEEQLESSKSDRSRETSAAQSPDEKSTAAGETIEMPPAGFITLIGMFSTQAMVGLGILPNPVTGKAEPQLEIARHFIDLLGVIEEKTKGNLDDSEKSMLTSTLHQLRMAFLQQSKEESQNSSEKTENSSSQEKS